MQKRAAILTQISGDRYYMLNGNIILFVILFLQTVLNSGDYQYLETITKTGN